jgi:hypothetical protein
MLTHQRPSLPRNRRTVLGYVIARVHDTELCRGISTVDGFTDKQDDDIRAVTRAYVNNPSYTQDALDHACIDIARHKPRKRAR